MLIIGENFGIIKIASIIIKNLKISKYGFADFILKIKIKREDNVICI